MVHYLITTGTSKTGAATIAGLKALGVAPEFIVAGSRDPSRTEAQLKSLGAGKVVHFDHEDEASIEKALVGIDRVLISVGQTPRIAPVYARVERIASKAGSSVKALVAIGAILTGPGEITKDFTLATNSVLQSKLDSAIVAPNWFHENWKLPEVLGQVQSGTLYGASGEGKVAYIAAEDIGHVVAAVLLNPSKYNGQTLNITGPQAFTEGEAATVFAQAGLGKKDAINYVSLPDADYRGILAGTGLPQIWVDYLSELEQIKLGGHASHVTNTIKEVTGRDPISLSTWAKQFATEQVAN